MPPLKTWGRYLGSYRGSYKGGYLIDHVKIMLDFNLLQPRAVLRTC